MFFSNSEKIDNLESAVFLFSPEKLTRLILLKEVKPFPDKKMIKLLTFDNLLPPLRHFR